ncbi:MAG: FAD-dependent thymidylate synthase [Candidatus Aenigmarchaeota archaeon]|nr:FAD-dependent thymidylate synthase [Candidatus Aenigmarchaeota archaeon]
MLTEDEKLAVSKFVTNTDKGIFALRNLPEVVKGALFSRYSRSSKGLREILLTEFLQNQGVSVEETQGNEDAATKKAEEFYDRVLVEYGDDSVAELGGAHIALENVSMIATKLVEDSRIGLSPLEKSTRYVYFNEKENGRYKYCREPAIMASRFARLYEETCDALFEAYSELLEPMKQHITKIFPKPPDMSDRAYAFTVRAKACDILRVFLPASTLTNMGIYGNGRAFEYLLTKLYASRLGEIKGIAAGMHEELRKVIPSFVKRPDEKHGIEYINYLKETDDGTERAVLSATKDAHDDEEVTLVNHDKDGEDKIVAAILYSHSQMPMEQCTGIVKKMGAAEKEKLMDEYTARRSNRRHKPGRAFENSYYTFDMLGNFGIYRDLHRHRVLTQQRQLLTALHGYDVPAELKEIGAEQIYHELMKKAKEAWSAIVREMPHEAQYVVPFGFRIRWYFTLNARELYHLTELRTVQQGHPDYRRICQKMARLAQGAHPAVFKNMRFVDFNSYAMERSEAEKRIDRKMEDMDKKYGGS